MFSIAWFQDHRNFIKYVFLISIQQSYRKVMIFNFFPVEEFQASAYDAWVLVGRVLNLANRNLMESVGNWENATKKANR